MLTVGICSKDDKKKYSNKSCSDFIAILSSAKMVCSNCRKWQYKSELTQSRLEVYL